MEHEDFNPDEYEQLCDEDKLKLVNQIHESLNEKIEDLQSEIEDLEFDKEGLQDQQQPFWEERQRLRTLMAIDPSPGQLSIFNTPRESILPS